MKLYAFTIGNSTAYVKLGLWASSPQEASARVRQEFRDRAKTVNEGASKQQMQELAAQTGLDPAAYDHLQFCEFGIEMPSSQFQLLGLAVNPDEITEEHIEWVRDATGEILMNNRHWRLRGLTGT